MGRGDGMSQTSEIYVNLSDSYGDDYLATPQDLDNIDREFGVGVGSWREDPEIHLLDADWVESYSQVQGDNFTPLQSKAFVVYVSDNFDAGSVESFGKLHGNFIEFCERLFDGERVGFYWASNNSTLTWSGEGWYAGYNDNSSKIADAHETGYDANSISASMGFGTPFLFTHEKVFKDIARGMMWGTYFI